MIDDAEPEVSTDAPLPKAPPRRLTVTEKLVRLRDAKRAALTKMQTRYARLAEETRAVAEEIAEAKAELRRINKTLPDELVHVVDGLSQSEPDAPRELPPNGQATA